MADQAELAVAIETARSAGSVIRAHYEGCDAKATYKDDGSPVTATDLEANDLIVSRLRHTFPNDAILSEESSDDGARLHASRVWIVDPLDGTRDFVQRSGDFSVHIGLAVQGKATLGVVYQPIRDRLFFAVTGQGAYEQLGVGRRRIRCSKRRDIAALRVGVTRYTITPSLQRLLRDAPFAGNLVRMGASTKMMAVACDELDVTLCLNDRENEWDTCAPEVIISESGGTMTDVDGSAFAYNGSDVRRRRGIVVSNGSCHAELTRLARSYFE